MSDFECKKCGKDMELKDTTYSNIKTYRAEVGQHTGDIYGCNNKSCEDEPLYIDDFLNNQFYEWSYQ